MTFAVEDGVIYFGRPFLTQGIDALVGQVPDVTDFQSGAWIKLRNHIVARYVLATRFESLPRVWVTLETCTVEP